MPRLSIRRPAPEDKMIQKQFAFFSDLCYNKKNIQGVSPMTNEEFKQAMSGVIAIYKWNSSTEIQLTPTEVKSLLGANNIYSDSGSVEVEYRADTTLAYNELLSLIASLS